MLFFVYSYLKNFVFFQTLNGIVSMEVVFIEKSVLGDNYHIKGQLFLNKFVVFSIAQTSSMTDFVVCTH